MNQFLDPGWIRHTLRYWTARLASNPQDELAWRTLASVEELAWQAGVEVPDLRPSARPAAAALVPVSDLEAHGLEVVWRDRLEGLRRELPVLRRQIERMTADLARLRQELCREGSRC